MKQFIFILALVSLAACGGSSRPRGLTGAPNAEGPISRACLAADRDAASRPLCGCVQYAANQTLSEADQRRAAGFFADPQEAQDVRQSDNSGAEAFWRRYRNFVDTAEALCRA